MPYKNPASEYQSKYHKQRCADDPEYAERQRSAKLASYHKNKVKDGKSRYDRRKEAGLCPRCGKVDTGGETCDKCLAVQRAANNKYVEMLFDHYGRACKCCGETERLFLSIDHINRDGAAQRRGVSGKNSGGGTNWRFYIVRNAMKTGEWPTDLQTLCFNCNFGRELNDGICPHQLTKDLSVAS